MAKAQIPPLRYEDWMNDFQKKILDRAYKIVKTIREEDEEWNLDFYSLINYTFEQEKEIEQKKIEIIQKILEDKDKLNFKRLKDNPEILKIIEEYKPDILLELEAIELTSSIVGKQVKYNNRKYLYIIFWSLLWIAIYPFWWWVIWFLLWYWIWYHFQPIKVVDRILKKKNNS